MSAGTPRVRVYTRPACHLCEAAVAVVEQVCADLGEAFEEVDITAGPEAERLTRAYGEEVPVTFVDGSQHDFWRVDADRLRAALTAG